LASLLSEDRLNLKRNTTKRQFLFFRFLLTKFVEGTEENWREEDTLLIILLFDKLTEVRDPSFRRRTLYYFSGIENLIRRIGRLPYQEAKKDGLFTVDRPSLFRLLLDNFALFGLVGNEELKINEIVSCRFNPSSSTRKQKRFIGVGYKDKGTLKNKVYDGSPGWTEVASCENFRNRVQKLEYSLRNPPQLFPT
jgi:hypothetical protein